MADSVIDSSSDHTRGLLRALIDELSGPAGSGDRARRRRVAADWLAAFPAPAALFGGIAGRTTLANQPWRALFGSVHGVPESLEGALETAVRVPSMWYRARIEVVEASLVRYVLVNAQSLRSARGTLVVCEDVTEQALADELALPDHALIWCVSPAGDVPYYGARWNVAIGRDWREAIDRRDLTSLCSALDANRTEELEVRIVRDGELRWHHVRFARYREHILFGAVDIHEERGRDNDRSALVELARQARADAEHARQLRDMFLATVSHELRAPLTTMLLWEKVLREGAVDEAARNQALDAIRQSATAQARLVADLLDFARGTTGKLYLDLRPLAVTKTISEAVDAARPLAAQKSIDLVGQVEPFEGVVHGDETRLRQTLDNLLANAIKFTSPGGRVTVSLACHRQQVTIKVADTGRGIAPESLERIFEPFSQADDTLTRREGGLGLGLTIARQIVELHHGTLVAESDGVDRGARFLLSLPVAGARHALVPPTGAALRRRLDGARVLVIDDDAEVRKALAVLLRRQGAVVDTAASASGAREQIASCRPHVLVCDIAMPDEDGYTFVRALRATGDTTPSIALTAFATSLDTERALQAGFDVHLTKPISLDRLVHAVRQLLPQELRSQS
jgi:signal transduction histidine kinase/ActR/RegA family two-component response regulator